MKTKNMTTLHLGNSIRRSPLRRGLVFIPLALCCFALSPAVRAVSPAPDGGYPGGNTAEGENALQSLTSGVGNTALGYQALYNNTSGSYNTANGFDALFSNTTGFDNTANGDYALYSNTTGLLNTANGKQVLFSNTTGFRNTAAGNQALYSNTTGSYNTANGFDALFTNTTGSYNTANGFDALFSNTTGSQNTANGWEALYGNTTGSNNIALGDFAGSNLFTGSSNIDIGNNGVHYDIGTIRIGDDSAHSRTFIAGIRNTMITGSAVYINTTTGQFGVLTSSERFKDGIEPMGNASEALLSLRPVTFRYKKNIDPKGASQFGLVAEEVEKVNPDLVVRGAEGKVFTVRYDAVNAMLLNEFLKEHRAVQELKSTVGKQEAIIAQQQKDFQATAAKQQTQIEALTADLQRVSAQVEMNRPAPRTVVNNQ
jgi:hypothetical protein